MARHTTKARELQYEGLSMGLDDILDDLAYKVSHGQRAPIDDLDTYLATLETSDPIDIDRDDDIDLDACVAYDEWLADFRQAEFVRFSTE